MSATNGVECTLGTIHVYILRDAPFHAWNPSWLQAWKYTIIACI